MPKSRFNPSLPRSAQRTGIKLDYVWPWKPDGAGPAAFHAWKTDECAVCRKTVRGKKGNYRGDQIRLYTEGGVRLYVHWSACWKKVKAEGLVACGIQPENCEPEPAKFVKRAESRLPPPGVVSPEEERARGKEVKVQHVSDLRPWQGL